tara:strand:- start:1976 stop:2272 length:297 start_codon:yes stop_codon:yes gene_type:complete
MKLLEMVELVQQHHPHMGETEIIRLLNRAKDDFCERTEIVKSTYTIQTTANQRYYALNDIGDDVTSVILKVKEVWLNDTIIPRLLEKPPVDDDTSELE